MHVLKFGVETLEAKELVSDLLAEGAHGCVFDIPAKSHSKSQVQLQLWRLIVQIKSGTYYNYILFTFARNHKFAFPGVEGK